MPLILRRISGDAYWLHDTFTGGAGTLPGHTPDIGAAWGSGANNSEASLDGAGLLKNDTTGIKSLYHPTVLQEANYYVEADVKTVGTSSNDRVGVYARGDGAAWTAADDYGDAYLARISGDGNLYLQAAGSYIGGAYAISGFSAATLYTLRLEVNGTSIKAFVDGVEVKSGTNGTITRIGQAGFYVRGNSIRISELRVGALT